jgi:GNAT superfamily N-acetyltransferase
VTALQIRPFTLADAGLLTDLLHRAYAELGAQGLNYTAVDQSAATTVHRATGGYCLIAELGGGMVGTATISLPPQATLRRMFAAADRDDVAWLGQLGVDPAHRGEGIARQLWSLGRDWASGNGATAIGVDTSIESPQLKALYESWGFRPVGTVHWEGKTYDSTVMMQAL